MRNDFTILRLSFSEYDREELRPTALAKLTTAIEELAVGELVRHGVNDVTLLLLAAPQPGSLEFRFRVDIGFKIALRHDTQKIIRSVPHAARHKLTQMAELAAIGAFLWGVMFGSPGIFHALQGWAQTSHSNVTSDELKARQLIIDMPTKRPRFAQGAPLKRLQNMIDAARGTGAESVSIQLPGEAPVVLYR